MRKNSKRDWNGAHWWNLQPFSKEANAVWQLSLVAFPICQHSRSVSYRSNSSCSGLVFGPVSPGISFWFLSVNSENGLPVAFRGWSTLMDGENKKKSLWTLLQYAMPFRGMWYYRFICYSTCFFVNYIFGDIFYYQYYNYCNCAILVLVLLLFFQDSRCIVNVSNKIKKSNDLKRIQLPFFQLKQVRLMMIVCSIIRDQCSKCKIDNTAVSMLIT